MKRARAASAVLFLFVLLNPAQAFASDPTPIAGIVLVAGAVALVVCAALAALHRFITIGLLVTTAIPIAYGVVLSLTYIASKARLGSVVFLAATLLYAYASFWRLYKDYWSKQ